MSKIFCIVGKSGSGKDTIYKQILSCDYPDLTPIITYTTRPKRINEKNGIDYNFVLPNQLNEFEKNNQILEKRQYSTVDGIWSYFTLKFELLCGKNYILITTIEGAVSIMQYYGEDIVHIIYLYLDDDTRLKRCLQRESKQINPNYDEVYRRFNSDKLDFSENKINKLKHIHKINTNNDINDCIKKWDTIYYELK